MKEQCVSSSKSSESEIAYRMTKNSVLEEAKRISSQSAHFREIASKLRSDARLTREIARTLRELKT